MPHAKCSLLPERALTLALELRNIAAPLAAMFVVGERNPIEGGASVVDGLQTGGCVRLQLVAFVSVTSTMVRRQR